MLTLLILVHYTNANCQVPFRFYVTLHIMGIYITYWYRTKVYRREKSIYAVDYCSLPTSLEFHEMSDDDKFKYFVLSVLYTHF